MEFIKLNVNNSKLIVDEILEFILQRSNFNIDDFIHKEILLNIFSYKSFLQELSGFLLFYIQENCYYLFEF